MKVNPDPPDNFLDRFVGAARKIEAILDSACKAGFDATELERGRLGLLHLRQVHLEKILRVGFGWGESSW